MSEPLDVRKLFEEIPDPRVTRTKRHRLIDVLLSVLLGTVAGCRGWDETVFFAQERELELREVMELAGGIPSAEILRRVMGAVDPKAYVARFLSPQSTDGGFGRTTAKNQTRSARRAYLGQAEVLTRSCSCSQSQSMGTSQIFGAGRILRAPFAPVLRAVTKAARKWS